MPEGPERVGESDYTLVSMSLKARGNSGINVCIEWDPLCIFDG
jgi:hypothetical protein